MKAMVLAGGLGTRLHPLTVNLPKPLVPVANRPLMEYVIEHLKQHGFDEIIVLLYYQPEIIKKHFGDGKRFGVKMSYVSAPKDFGTAGAVKFAAKDLSEPFLVISADLICDFDLSRVIKFHKDKKSIATMVLTRAANPLPYGIVILNKENKIKHFLEKPSWSEVFSDTINCGIYLLDPKALEYIPSEKNFDFSHDLFPKLLAEKLPLFGFVADGTWKDIGSLLEYSICQRELIGGEKNKIDGSAKIADDAQLVHCSVGKNCQIGRGAVLKGAILWDNVIIGAEVKIERGILASNTTVGDRTVIEEGAVIGEGCHIGKDALVKAFVKIWPNRIVEEGAVVSRSMVWRERWTKGIFGPYGVTGRCNIEITPEFAAALGAAYGTILGKGAEVVASRDSHKSSRMIFRALISGLLSAGVNISNLEDVPIPINRYEIRSLKSKGGVHVRKSPYDPDIIDIKLLDEDGSDLRPSKEKKIERLFFGEDFMRAGIEDVGELSFPYHRVAESYKAGILSLAKAELIRSAGIKAVIDYSYSSASKIFPSILGELGIEVVALNAYIDETKITKNKAVFERELNQLSEIVKSLKADIGIMLDTGAEKIFLCDEKGRILLGDAELAAITLLNLKSYKGPIAVPVKASRVIDDLAKAYGAKVKRSKNSSQAMMETASLPHIKFLGEPLGGFIFPEFQPTFDALFATVKILELLAEGKIKLSGLVDEIPKIHMASKEISCASEQKGKVLRSIVDGAKDEEVDLTDGVKLFHGASKDKQPDWVLILPDPARPVIQLYAEAGSDKEAKKLISDLVEKIDALKQ
ncbi:MAG: mannose-1-phosphate guanyltransferase [Candidatus Margulisbacteria bacterium]|nr:mannose-1-phosphate guanyltransferase [Candidatus Margulisiibacteriota bacterium]